LIYEKNLKSKISCQTPFNLCREEAEVLSLKSQVDLISYWESILLNDPYSFLTSWPKVIILTPKSGSGFT
jgi:hypothetical protein